MKTNLQPSFDCAFERKTLRCSYPFRFKEKNPGTAVLAQDDGDGPAFSCGCGSPACEIQIAEDGREISCSENACRGNWGWRVSIPGLSKSFVMLAR